ncbi:MULTISPECIES: hypothetical protein [Bradyrhizobium]|uniref:HTH-like domain-containing protein n=1 Tax=Bradyrhizobium guangdongense TaxID=1325090 RepID=A0AA87WB01_9BRAD|nr:hypothetical protein GCM10010987_62920 [Bradyrhizobium guangdongense]
MSLSVRSACSIISADRKMIRYQSSRPLDAELRGRLRDLATGRRRSFGYRRVFVLLRREAEPWGISRIYRHYREEALASASGELAARPWGPGPDSGAGQAQCTLVAGLRS